jgi:glyoxylase-like metal-dependent hydrolase (beta-lactamase superfamily II)
MKIKTFFDPRTSTLTHLVWDEHTRDAVVIDPVLDFEPTTGRVWTESAERVATFAKAEDLKVHYALETHAHADHLSGGQVFVEQFGAKTVISREIKAVQEVFAPVFGKGGDFPLDGSQFDALVEHGEVLEAGALQLEVIHTPGHTPACVTWKIEDALFTGDALFMPDFGTGRCDFPAGSAEDLYDSVTNRLYVLPDDTRVFVGHDYQPGDRELAWETTIGASKAENKQLTATTDREDFVSWRTERDATLSAPRLLLPSIQVNIDAGRLPAADAEGGRHLRLPLKVEGL